VTEPIRVLLVDDEARFVENLARLLKGRGMAVAAAQDGMGALHALRQDPSFDVAVVDVKMPGMDGITLLNEIKRIAPHMEVVMLTGNATVESGIEAVRAGAFDYLLKPCDIETLVEKIHEAHEVEDIRRHPVLWPRSLVKEITWPSYVRLETGDTLTDALSVFMREAGMPVKEDLYVLDGDDRLQGVITRRDLLEAAGRSHPERDITWRDLVETPSLLPDEHLDTVVHRQRQTTISPETDLPEAARQMIAHGVRCLPVAENGKVVGILRLIDVLKHLEHAAGPSPSDT